MKRWNGSVERREGHRGLTRKGIGELPLLRRRQSPEPAGCSLGWAPWRRLERPKQSAIITPAAAPIAIASRLLARLGLLAATRKAEAIGNYRFRGGPNRHRQRAVR